MDPSKENKQKNKLSILISQDGLSFCISSIKNKTVSSFYKKLFDSKLDPENLLKELQSAFTYSLSDKLSKIEEVEVIYANDLYTIVPQKLFNKENLTDYLKFNTKILYTDFIAVDEIPTAAANAVYIPFTNINNYLFDTFGEFTYRHSASLLIEECLKGDTAETVKAQVVVYSTHFDLCITKEGKLILCNNFEYSAPQDFIYFLLFCFEQLKINTEEVILELSGDITEDSDLYGYIYTYIRNVSFLEPSFQEENIQAENLKVQPQYINHLLLHTL